MKFHEIIRPNGASQPTADELTRDFRMEEAIYRLADPEDRAPIYRTLLAIRDLAEVRR